MGVENIVWGEDCILASPNPNKPAAAQGSFRVRVRGEVESILYQATEGIFFYDGLDR
jgi:hypothetical protein